MQMRQGIERNPHKYLSNTPGGVQASASQPPDPHKKTRLFFSRWDVVCFCIHWVVQNTNQHPLLVHIDSVYTIWLRSYSFLFSFLSRSPQFPPATPNNPPPFNTSLLLFLFSWRWEQPAQFPDGWRYYLLLSEKRDGKSQFGRILVSAVSGIWRLCIASYSLLPTSMQTKQDLGSLFC